MTTQERYIPKGYSLIRETPHGVFYGHETAVIVYKGRARKSLAHYGFKTTERRNEYIDEMASRWASWEEQKLVRKMQKQKEMSEVQIGDILYNSWGYEQTNVDFYQVIQKNKASFVARPICKTQKETGFMCGEASPIPNDFDGEPRTYRSMNFTQWDGSPKYYSTYA